MSHRKGSKFLSASIDLSNHSFADIIESASERYSCYICKETDVADGLAEFCSCASFFHEQCLTKLIDDWISDDLSDNERVEARHAEEKPYVCRVCGSQVFYKSKQRLACKNGSEMCKDFKKGPLKSFFEVFFFFLGLAGLVFGILVKTGRYCLQIDGLNKITMSVIVIGLLVVASLIVLISFYYIFVDLLTDKRKRVEKVYQRGKKTKKKSMDLITVRRIS